MTPGPFLGSMPSPDIGGARLSRQLDLLCSALAILAAAAVWLGAWRSGPLYDVADLMKVSCAVLLVAALLGIGLINTAAGWERLGIAIIMEAVGRQLRLHQGRRAVRLAPEETPARGIAGLIEALVWRVRRLNASPSNRPAEAGDLYEAALRQGRAQAQLIVQALYRDADTLGEASGEIEAAAERLDAGGREAGSACATTEAAMSRTEQHLISLTKAVAATTAELRRVTETAVTLSDRAFAARRSVADMDDGAARLLTGIDQIEGLVRRLSMLGQAAVSEAAKRPEAGAQNMPVAAGIRELVQATVAALSALQADAAIMSGQVAAAVTTAQEICDWVSTQHDIGLALSHAVGQQGEEIAAVLRSLEEARSGFVTLRASVDAVTRLGTTRLATTGTLREAAGRLPSHADAVMTILRDLPDFAPSSRFDP